MSSKETIEEFLARGGEIRRFPEEEREETQDPTMKPSNEGPPQLMSLVDGAFFFAERKTRKSKKSFDEKLNGANLPQETIDKIKNSYKSKNQ